MPQMVIVLTLFLQVRMVIMTCGLIPMTPSSVLFILGCVHRAIFRGTEAIHLWQSTIQILQFVCSVGNVRLAIYIGSRVQSERNT